MGVFDVIFHKCDVSFNKYDESFIKCDESFIKCDESLEPWVGMASLQLMWGFIIMGHVSSSQVRFCWPFRAFCTFFISAPLGGLGFVVEMGPPHILLLDWSTHSFICEGNPLP